MKNSGLADSPFFSKNPPKLDPVKERQLSEPDLTDLKIEESSKTTAPIMMEENDDANHHMNQDAMIPRHHDTMIPRHHDTMVEAVRLAVEKIGKEATTYRFTIAEKEAISAIVYAYKRRGIRTSENEITRIAVNMLLQVHDSESNGSLLNRVLQALNA